MTPFHILAKKARQAKNLTLREAANKVDAHYTTISKIENNQFQPSEDLVKKLARVYEQDFYSFCRKAGIVPSELINALLSDASLYEHVTQAAKSIESFKLLVSLAKEEKRRF